MEIIVLLVVVAGVAIWYYTRPPKEQFVAAPANEADSAPYKLETPPAAPTVTEVAAAAEPVAAEPKKAKKAAASKAKKPAAMKAKEKAPAKKPRAKKAST